jgi:hypothetical protein
MTQLEKLCMIPNTQGRIDAIAADLTRMRRRFDKIDLDDLAAALSLEQGYERSSNIQPAIWKVSLDEIEDEFPAWDHLELLQGQITRRRYEELKAQGQDIEDGRRNQDITLRPRERQLMEDAISRREMDAGNGWLYVRDTLQATDGTYLHFQCVRGCGGDMSDWVGPYEIHDKGWPIPKGVITGEPC